MSQLAYRSLRGNLSLIGSQLCLHQSTTLRHRKQTKRKVLRAWLMRMKKRVETLKELLETRKTHGVSNLGQRKNERMALVRDPCRHVEVLLLVMQRAEAVQENLDANFPSFSLPKVFCHLHMPSRDTTIILEDEFRRQYRTRYLAERRGLSAGWMGFSIAHNLAEGDVLVFHLVRYNELKHYKISGLELGISSLADAITCRIAGRDAL